jgi:hypothetical protein
MQPFVVKLRVESREWTVRAPLTQGQSPFALARAETKAWSHPVLVGAVDGFHPCAGPGVDSLGGGVGIDRTHSPGRSNVSGTLEWVVLCLRSGLTTSLVNDRAIRNSRPAN